MKSHVTTTTVLTILLGAFYFGPAGAAPLVEARVLWTAASTPLGDLSLYRTITADTLALIDKGDLVAAQKRGTDLETAWDKAEDTMKPNDPKRWRLIDKAIDRVLHELRAATPQP